ncbi:MAG: 30S ribosomal protein S9 [Patescibacteria group bacterium]|jgi:small subunit ribosomal protein S9|nr:30S ribosomal protein S9 [Patescibacteria group bacterium]
MVTEKQEKYYYGRGRRKEASARVRLFFGKGQSTINDKSVEDYFGKDTLLINNVAEPLQLTGQKDKAYFCVKIVGGGLSGQSDAIRLGLARALLLYDENLKATLRKAGLLTRDPREKERKKYGLKRARKAPQFSKR